MTYFRVLCEIEKNVYLRLNQSIDVLVMPNDNVNEIEKNVKVIQIADDNSADWQELKKGGIFALREYYSIALLGITIVAF